MLKAKYQDNPGTKTKCAALTFSLKILHPEFTILCYRTIIPPCKTYKPNFISAQLFWCIYDQTAFVIEGRNVSLHVAPDEITVEDLCYENRLDLA